VASLGLREVTADPVQRPAPNGRPAPPRASHPAPRRDSAVNHHNAVINPAKTAEQTTALR
jgi:hypothetical protein